MNDVIGPGGVFVFTFGRLLVDLFQHEVGVQGFLNFHFKFKTG